METAACVAACLGGAVATAWLGVQWRGWAAARFGHDWVGASLEDLTAIAFAATAAALTSSSQSA